jgi:hypothetical protein
MESLRKKLFRSAYRVFEFLASLELAVFLILALAVVLAVGTVYESKYGTAVASREVYRSVWMQILLWVFMLNLAAVAMSRLPWKRHHIGFLLTHLGIIILLLGSWITQRSGVDGNLVLAPGESGRAVRIDENMLYIFRTLPGKTYELVLGQRLDFDQRRPLARTLSFPFEDAGGKQEAKILRYLPKATREVAADIVPDGKGMPGLKFQMTGSRATFSDWLFLQADTGAVREVGPAIFRFSAGKPDLKAAPAKATVALWLEGGTKLPPKMAVARAGQNYREVGRIKPGVPVDLGWMDFQFILGEYYPSALPRAEYFELPKDRPSKEALEVVEVGFGDQTLWLELGSAGQIPVGDSLYYIQYTKKQVELDFEVKLKDFKIGYYEGTTRPKTYSSEVEVQGAAHTIAMNEPLLHGGYRFYQASYEADENGVPQYSVLSVNLDPGRSAKYFGCFMMVLGIVSMFYFKPIYSGKHKLLKKQEGARV